MAHKEKPRVKGTRPIKASRISYVTPRRAPTTRVGYVSHSSKVYVDNSPVSGNSIPVITGPYSRLVGGGGALARGSSFIARESTIVYNYAFNGGGGIRLYDVFPAKILSSTVVGNSTCCYDAGNGILVTGGSATFSEAIVANNVNRGGYNDIAGTFEVDRSLVRSPGSASITGTDSLFGVDPKLGKLDVNGRPTLTMLPAADSPAVEWRSIVRTPRPAISAASAAASTATSTGAPGSGRFRKSSSSVTASIPAGERKRGRAKKGRRQLTAAHWLVPFSKPMDTG